MSKLLEKDEIHTVRKQNKTKKKRSCTIICRIS